MTITRLKVLWRKARMAEDDIRTSTLFMHGRERAAKLRTMAAAMEMYLDELGAPPSGIAAAAERTTMQRYAEATRVARQMYNALMTARAITVGRDLQFGDAVQINEALAAGAKLLYPNGGA